MLSNEIQALLIFTIKLKYRNYNKFIHITRPLFLQIFWWNSGTVSWCTMVVKMFIINFHEIQRVPGKHL